MRSGQWENKKTPDTYVHNAFIKKELHLNDDIKSFQQYVDSNHTGAFLHCCVSNE